MTTFADAYPARGASLEDLVLASLLGLIVVGGVAVAGALYASGRLAILDRLAHSAERVLGVPGWAAMPFAVAGPALLSALFGFYWDVSWHIDRGRDPGPFANPAHWFIFVGLGGVALAGALGILLGSRRPPDGAVRIGRWARAPVGAVLLLLTGGVALLGFPLDDVWHRLFGQDVTLWGPTHIQMIAGASLAALALMVLEVEALRTLGRQARPPWLIRVRGTIGAAGFLVGLSTLQGEFDFGVPQFRQLYHPVLIMLAAGIGLVAVRIRGGRGSALGAAVGFLVIRGLLTLAISAGLDRSLLHFPLYLPEALLVELVALRIPKDRPLRLAAFAGASIGTVGLAAEWGWSHVWMPLPWHRWLAVEAIALGFAAAVGGSVIGALIGSALRHHPVHRPNIARGAAVLAGAAVLFCLAYPLRMTARPSDRATVSLRAVGTPSNPEVLATVLLEPRDLAERAYWFDVTAWQGAGSSSGGLVISPFVPVGPGLYRIEKPVPVGGTWKTLIRFHTGNILEVVPIFMPPDPAIPAPPVPAFPRFTRSFEPDKRALQREAVGGSTGLQRGAYALMAAIGVAWVASFAWGLARLTRGERVRLAAAA